VLGKGILIQRTTQSPQCRLCSEAFPGGTSLYNEDREAHKDSSSRPLYKAPQGKCCEHFPNVSKLAK